MAPVWSGHGSGVLAYARTASRPRRRLAIDDDDRGQDANNRLEDEERKDPILNAQDYMKLNADGSCEFYTTKVKGRYEIKTSSGGYQSLVLFDKDNTKLNRGRIYSVTKDELILIDHSSGSTFKVYKRL